MKIRWEAKTSYLFLIFDHITLFSLVTFPYSMALWYLSKTIANPRLYSIFTQDVPLYGQNFFNIKSSSSGKKMVWRNNCVAWKLGTERTSLCVKYMNEFRYKRGFMVMCTNLMNRWIGPTISMAFTTHVISPFMWSRHWKVYSHGMKWERSCYRIEFLTLAGWICTNHTKRKNHNFFAINGKKAWLSNTGLEASL